MDSPNEMQGFGLKVSRREFKQVILLMKMLMLSELDILIVEISESAMTMSQPLAISSSDTMA